jgi:hypothetical protein
MEDVRRDVSGEPYSAARFKFRRFGIRALARPAPPNLYGNLIAFNQRVNVNNIYLSPAALLLKRLPIWDL